MSNARNLARLLPNASGQLADANMASGSVIQVVQNYYRGSHTATSSSSYVPTGVTASITPISSTSKILVIAALTVSADTDTYGAFRLYRNGADVVDARSGTASGNRENAFINISQRDVDSPYEIELKTNMFLDSPNSTNTQTYEIFYRKTYGGAIYLGRPAQDADQSFIVQAPYSITLMEIAQ